MKLVVLMLLSLITFSSFAQAPVRIAVAGLSHGHVGWVFNRKEKKDTELVGIYEKDKALAEKFIKRYNLDPKLFYDDLDQMLAATKPEAVTAFGPINEHIRVVRAARKPKR